MEKTTKIVGEAIRSLRKDYGMSQQYFATYLRMSISSLANYEIGVRSPDAAAAVKFYRAADEINREDLVDLFASIYREAMGGLVSPVRDEAEQLKVKALRLILSDARFEDLRGPLNEVLAPVEAHLKAEKETPEDTCARGGPPGRKGTPEENQRTV